MCFASPLFSQDASTAWRNILRKCAKSDLIGTQSLFFGVSNTIGPGSVWRIANDKSIRLMFELSDAFPNDSDQAKLVKVNNVASCLGSSSSSWNIKLGLPFSTGVTPLSLNIGALLGQAKKVTVSVSGFAVDDIKETNWKQAFRELDPNNAYAKEVLQPNRLLAENVVKVTGFRAVFDYKNDLDAEAQATFKGKSFTLGNSSAPSAGPGAPGATSTANPSGGAPSELGGNATTPSANASAGPCSAASGAASGANPGGTGAGSTSTGGGGPGTGSATLRVDFTSSRQIVICADGPFYLIAAYSNLQKGEPVGMVPTAPNLVLTPATLPKNAIAGSERTPKP
jgi:hypothetical protein